MNQTRSSPPKTFWLNDVEQKLFYPYVDYDSGDQIISLDLDGSNPQAVRSRENVYNGILSGATDMILVGDVFYWINSIKQAIRTERLKNGMYHEQNILPLDYDRVGYELSGLALWADDLQQQPGK